MYEGYRGGMPEVCKVYVALLDVSDGAVDGIGYMTINSWSGTVYYFLWRELVT